MIRHFTASGLIFRDGHVLLVRHLKPGLWLYPGGHLNDNEDPAQAALREISEEVALPVEIVSEQRFSHPAVGIVPVPFTIMVVDIGDHQHIDMVYLCRPLPGQVTEQLSEIGGHQWVPAGEVARLMAPPELPELCATAATYLSRLEPSLSS